MPIEAVNDATRREWRDPGFFYDRDDDRTEVRVVGSRLGLLKFRDILVRYVTNPRSQSKSEHDHYGPYMYLKILTWSEAGMDRNAIYGTLQDLRRLAGMIEARLEDTRAGSVLRIREEFARDCEYSLVLDVRDKDFDPASVDLELTDQAG